MRDRTVSLDGVRGLSLSPLFGGAPGCFLICRPWRHCETDEIFLCRLSVSVGDSAFEKDGIRVRNRPLQARLVCDRSKPKHQPKDPRSFSAGLMFHVERYRNGWVLFTWMEHQTIPCICCIQAVVSEAANPTALHTSAVQASASPKYRYQSIRQYRCDKHCLVWFACQENFGSSNRLSGSCLTLVYGFVFHVKPSVRITRLS